jgi:hypothetical protein
MTTRAKQGSREVGLQDDSPVTLSGNSGLNERGGEDCEQPGEARISVVETELVTA